MEMPFPAGLQERIWSALPGGGGGGRMEGRTLTQRSLVHEDSGDSVCFLLPTGPREAAPPSSAQMGACPAAPGLQVRWGAGRHHLRPEPLPLCSHLPLNPSLQPVPQHFPCRDGPRGRFQGKAWLCFQTGSSVPFTGLARGMRVRRWGCVVGGPRRAELAEPRRTPAASGPGRRREPSALLEVGLGQGPTLSGPHGSAGENRSVAAPAGPHPVGHREATTQGSLETGFIGVAGVAPGSLQPLTPPSRPRG